MKHWIAALAIAVTSATCLADTIATLPNKGGGKIVFTDEACKSGGKTYERIKRVYNYTAEGYSSEGCYYVEDDTVVVIWDMSGGPEKRRYPIDSLTFSKKYGKNST